MNVFNDPAGGGIDNAISDDPRLAVQTLKSHASDLISILKEAELKGFQGDFRQTGLTLAARVLKSMAEAQLELRKLRRNLLQQTLAVEQSIFGASQADWMSFADARFDAIDELTDIRTTRFALESAAAQRFPGALILQPPTIGAFDLTDPHAAVAAVLAPRPALTFEDIISAPDPILDPAASPTIDGVRSGIAATEAAIDAASRHLERLEGKRGQIRGLETRLAGLQAEQSSVARELGELRDSTWEPLAFSSAATTPSCVSASLPTAASPPRSTT
jgi:hypothetical protein